MGISWEMMGISICLPWNFHRFSRIGPISLLRCQEPGGRPRGVWRGRTAPGDAKQGAKTVHRDGPGNPWMKIVDEKSDL